MLTHPRTVSPEFNGIPTSGEQSTKKSNKDVYFVVEFKGGRNDIFRLNDDFKVPVKVGDLVIVEADRGKDLGKVIADNIRDLSKVQNGLMLEKTIESMSDNISMIYRHAQSEEVSMLLDKARDEAKCLAVVQAKVRQKSLPMEVIDAEYQWLIFITCCPLILFVI